MCMWCNDDECFDVVLMMIHGRNDHSVLCNYVYRISTKKKKSMCIE